MIKKLQLLNWKEKNKLLAEKNEELVLLVMFGEVKSLVENDIRMLCERKGSAVIE